MFLTYFVLWTLCLPLLTSEVRVFWQQSLGGAFSGKLLSVLGYCGHTGLEQQALPFLRLFTFALLCVCVFQWLHQVYTGLNKEGWFDLVPSNSSFSWKLRVETSMHWVLFLLLIKYSDARTKYSVGRVLCECLNLFWLWVELGLGVWACACTCVCVGRYFYQNTCIVSINFKHFLKDGLIFFSSYHSFFHSNKIL